MEMKRMIVLLMCVLVGVNSLMAANSLMFYKETGSLFAAFLFALQAATAVWCLIQAWQMNK